MLKSRFFYLRYVATIFLLCSILFTTCQDSSGNDDTTNKPDNPTGNTWIEFKNLEEFPVTIYSDPARQVVFAEIPSTGTKKVSAEPAPMGRAFYPTFVLIYPIGTTININIPYNGSSITAAILADKTNTVSIPKLESITTNSAYVTLINNSGFSLTFNEGPLEKSPIGGGSSIINNGQNASYEITPGSVSAYSVLRNGSIPVAFPADLTEFKAGIAYVFTYNGTALTATNQLPINTEINVPGNSLATKLAWLRSNLLSNRSYFIEITADENIAPQNLSYNGKSGIIIILNGGGAMRTINLSAQGSLFTIDSGVTLILNNNITLEGGSNNSSLVTIGSYGTLVMNDGTIITGNDKYNYGNGGGVFVDSNGTFTMNGGEISGNTASGYGGGVYVYVDGNFTMNNGEISVNTGYYLGGGVCVDRGTFNMRGGKISGNTASYNGGTGGGVCVYVDGSLTMNNGAFIMSGGVIYGNNSAADLKNTAKNGTALYKYSSSTAQYGTFNGNTFTRLGDLTTTDTTIRVVNGSLLTE